MSKMALMLGILCVVVAVVVLIFADGLRRWYSGLFFVFLAVVMFANAARWRRATGK
jgi:hypothetical protein